MLFQIMQRWRGWEYIDGWWMVNG